MHGLTPGVGVSHALGNGLIGRGEIIHDRFNQSTQASNDPDQSGTTARLALISRFRTGRAHKTRRCGATGGGVQRIP